MSAKARTSDILDRERAKNAKNDKRRMNDWHMRFDHATKDKLDLVKIQEWKKK